MKTLNQVVCGGLLLGVVAASVPSAQAGDREWATAGKVLTGVAIANVLHNVLTPRCETTTTYVYHQPQPVVVQPQVVYVTQPAPVVVQQPCAVVQPQIVHVVQQAPVVVYHRPAPVIVRSGPVIHVRHGGRFDHGHRGHGPRGHGHGRW